MALPWLRILDLALTGLEFARKTNRRSLSAALGEPNSQLTTGSAGGGTSDATLATVVVAALKEAFNRDHQRLEYEREQREAERRRAERLLKLELARQAGDREIGRLRVLAITAIVSLLATLVLAGVGSVASTAARVALGVGWVCLLAAIAAAFSGQSAVAADSSPPATGSGIRSRPRRVQRAPRRCGCCSPGSSCWPWPCWCVSARSATGPARLAQAFRRDRGPA